MPDGFAADIRLGDLVHLDGGLHTDGHLALLERVRHGEGVDDRRQHTHMVCARALHPAAAVLDAAPEVAAADHDADLHAEPDTFFDHVAHAADHIKIQPAPRLACQRLAAELQQHALIFRFAHGTIHSLAYSILYSIIFSAS